MGSPMVFHTAPPQPASKARMTCSPVLVGGPEASQKGLGQRMPAKLVARSAMVHHPEGSAFTVGYGIHHFAAAVDAIAAGVVFRIAGAASGAIHGDGAAVHFQAQHGVAFVSYNALPGGRVRQIFRDMMLFHLGTVTDFEARIHGAREVVQWFQACQPSEEPSAIFQSQVDSIMQRPPRVLYHDELGAVYHPVYFQEFAAHAARFGLQFLAEANYHDMQPGRLPAAVVAQIDRVAAANRIVRDQYFDFMKCRMFRQTLLCHQTIVLPDAPLAARLPLLCAASAAKPVTAKPDLTAGVAEEFRGGQGTGVTTAHPLTKAVMLLLSEAWPQTLSIPDLLAGASRLAGEQPGPEGLAPILLATYSAGVIELHAQPPHCVARVSQFPTASQLARSQARRGRLMTTTRHTTFEGADEKVRTLIGLLDGTRDFAALVRELRPVLQLPEDVLVKGIQANLTLLAEMGVLVA